MPVTCIVKYTIACDQCRRVFGTVQEYDAGATHNLRTYLANASRLGWDCKQAEFGGDCICPTCVEDDANSKLRTGE